MTGTLAVDGAINLRVIIRLGIVSTHDGAENGVGRIGDDCRRGSVRAFSLRQKSFAKTKAKFLGGMGFVAALISPHDGAR